MEFEIGKECTVKTTVDKTNVASAVGSGAVDVFSTPMMIAQMELAACKCMEPYLAEGQGSVGATIQASHTAATPIGMEVMTTAKITAVDRKRVDFEIVARDEIEEIGRGTHSRFVIDMNKFMDKAMGKKK